MNKIIITGSLLSRHCGIHFSVTKYLSNKKTLRIRIDTKKLLQLIFELALAMRMHWTFFNFFFAFFKSDNNNKYASSHSVEDNITFSRTSQSCTNVVDNISFKINPSETGESLLLKEQATQHKSYKLKLPSTVAHLSKPTGEVASSLNLKSINQELDDREQNRLATSNKQQRASNINAVAETTKRHIAGPLLSSSIKSSQSSSNLKVLMNMDDTVSSINSSNVTTSSSASSYSRKSKLNPPSSKVGKDVKKSRYISYAKTQKKNNLI